MPEKEITPRASQVTHLAVVRGRLCLRGKPVDSKSANEGLKSFVEWLKAKGMPVVLFAHNAKSFDCKRIIYSLQKCDLLSSFQSCVVGFVDTLILFKTILPQREKYSQKVWCQIFWEFLIVLMTLWKMSGLFSNLFPTRK